MPPARRPLSRSWHRAHGAVTVVGRWTGKRPSAWTAGVVVALAAMVAAVFVIANDFTALSVALPNIEREFDSDVSTVQWVINAYALVFGVLVVTGGRLADLFGRRRVFFVGSAVFAGFSLLGALAQSDIWLIACRALMGIGGAMMWPAVLGYDLRRAPGVQGRARRRADHRGSRLRQRRGAADRRGNHRLLRLAVGSGAQPPGRRLGLRGDLVLDPPAGGRVPGPSYRLRGCRLPSHRARRPLAGAGSGRRLGLGRSAGRGADRGVRGAPGGLRALRAPRGPARPDPPPTSWQPGLSLRLPRGAADVPNLLRRSALPASVPAEGARLRSARGGRGAIADDGHVRRRVVRGRAPLRAAWGKGRGVGRSRVPRDWSLPDLANRQRLRLRRLGAGHGGAWARGRRLLLVGHHRRRHRARPVAREPGRRPRLHVPDSRRLRWPRAYHGDLHHRGPRQARGRAVEHRGVAQRRRSERGARRARRDGLGHADRGALSRGRGRSPGGSRAGVVCHRDALVVPGRRPAGPGRLRGLAAVRGRLVAAPPRAGRYGGGVTARQPSSSTS